jgi:hypothetical protein
MEPVLDTGFNYRELIASMTGKETTQSDRAPVMFAHQDLNTQPGHLSGIPVDLRKYYTRSDGCPDDRQQHTRYALHR